MICSRRAFLGTGLAGLAAASVPRSLLGALTPHEPFAEIRRGVGLFSSTGGTIGWLVNPSGALVVDSQFPDSARICVDGLGERGAASVDALLNTHHHADHTAGNGVFRDLAGAIVAQENAMRLQRAVAMERDTEAAQTYADTTFETEWSCDLGDERVRARHFGPAHTAGDCTVHFERADVVHMGDLVFNRAYPFIDRAGGASIPGWIDLLERVAAAHTEETIYIFGHANPAHGVTGRRADLLRQRDFLSAVRAHAERAVGEGKSREEASALEQLSGFEEFAPLADWLTLENVLGAAFDEVREG